MLCLCKGVSETVVQLVGEGRLIALWNHFLQVCEVPVSRHEGATPGPLNDCLKMFHCGRRRSFGENLTMMPAASRSWVARMLIATLALQLDRATPRLLLQDESFSVGLGLDGCLTRSEVVGRGLTAEPVQFATAARFA